jgi:uncharacterized protein DUF3995
VTHDRTERRRRWGYLAAAWCLLFAVPHLYWALGGSFALAVAAGADLADERPTWFVVGGLWGVAAALLVGAGFCVGLARWWPAGTLRRLTAALGWAGGALLVLRGLLVEVLLATGAGGVADTVGASQTRWSLLVWNPWFVVGGVLVLLATREFARSTRS